jgi:hypothetical protein
MSCNRAVAGLDEAGKQKKKEVLKMKKSYLFSAGLIVCVLLLSGSITAAHADKSTCAVLSFKEGKGLHAGEVSLLCNKFTVLLNETGRYNVIAKYKVNSALIAHGFNRALDRSTLKAAIAAGEILQVDYVIYGAVYRSGQGFVLRTALADVATGKDVGSAHTTVAGNWLQFVAEAPEPNLQNLLKIDNVRAPAIERLPVAPVQPVREPVRLPRPIEPVPEPIPEPEPVPVPEPIPKPEPRRTWRESIPKLRINMDWMNRIGEKMQPTWNDMQGAAAGRLEVGTRSAVTLLLEGSKDSFVGTIDKLEPSQNLWPLRLFADWYFAPEWGAQLTWASMTAKSSRSPDGVSDGDFVLSGPVIGVVGRYDTGTPYTPYGGIGLAFLDAGFEPEGWWNLGYHSPSEWTSLGSPAGPNGGITQMIKMDDPVGIMFQGGCVMKIRDRWSADVCLRLMRVSSDAHHSMYLDNAPLDIRDAVSVPLSYMELGAGIRYAFW